MCEVKWNEEKDELRKKEKDELRKKEKVYVEHSQLHRFLWGERIVNKTPQRNLGLFKVVT